MRFPLNATATTRFRRPIWVLALLVMVLGLLAPSASVRAHADTTGITGRIVNSDGVPVAGLTVGLTQRVSDGAGIRWQTVPGVTATSASNGDYAISAPAGTYRVSTAATSAYVSTYYPSVSYVDLATDVVVTTTLATARNIVVNRPGSVSGTVARALDRAPVTGATATLERLRTSPSPAAWIAVGPTATTGASGTYQINQVSPGSSYRVRVTGPGFASQVTPSGGSVSVDESEDSSVPDVLLFADDEGIVEGQVTNTAGQPVINVQVRARQQIVTPEGTTWAVVGDPVATGVDGRYVLSLPSATYRLEFSGSQLATRYYPAGDTLDQGADVTVFAGDYTSGQDVEVNQIGGGTRVIANLEPPAVLGNAGVGQTLTADPGTWTPATGTTFTYQWLRCAPPASATCIGDDIDGATSATYSIPGGLGTGVSGSRYRVEVRPVTTSLTLTSQATSPATGFLQQPTGFENRGRPVVTGTPAPGQTLTTTKGKWSTVPTAVTLQWYADGTPIFGATTTTYVVKVADLGARISVLATATSAGSTAQATSVPTAVVGLNQIQHLVAPRITGVARSGDTLTSEPGSWSETDLTYSYLWFADELAIPGATSSTYKPTAAQVDKRIRVLVQVSKAGYASAAALSARTLPVVQAGAAPDGGILTNVAPPTITGTPAVGGTVTAAPGSWTPEPTSYKYQWRANGTDIAGATSASLVLTEPRLGNQLTVVVTAVKEDFPDRSATSAAVNVAAGTITNTTPPAISGTAQVGRVLTSSTGSWLPSTVTPSYQWSSNGAQISGATSRTLTVPASASGTLITVTVTVTRNPAYAPTTITSSAVGPVAKGTISVSSSPSIVGSPRYQQTLRAVVPSTTPSTTRQLQWLRNGAAIPSATGSTYRTTSSDLGKQLSVRVTYSATGYTTTTRTSTRTAVVKTQPTLSISAAGGKTKSTFTIRVNAPGAPNATGVVQLRSNGKVVAQGRLSNGQVKISLADSKKLKAVQVVYLGEARAVKTVRNNVAVP
ncbi:MAG: Cna protein B-type domain protein [Marmoricola sp.]|nr:Cna protein B-type domain protein [Marmoricola sp.]